MTLARYTPGILLPVALLMIGALGCEARSPSAPRSNAMPIASPIPTPTQYTATPVPFNLTQSRMLDILGWDSWGTAPTPSVVQFRWNAASGKYEVLAPGYADWTRLEALQELRFWRHATSLRRLRERRNKTPVLHDRAGAAPSTAGA